MAGTDPKFQPVPEPLLVWLGAWGRAGGTGQGWSAGTGRDFTRLPAPACWLPLVTSSQLRAVPRVDPNTEGLIKRSQAAPFPHLHRHQETPSAGLWVHAN